MKSAIVFGGSGFIGSHVSEALTNAGIKVTIFDIRQPEHINENQLFIHGNVLDQNLVDKWVCGKDYVYHFAGQADIEIGFETPKDTVSLNIQGTINVLEACRKHNIKRLIFASTLYVYSDTGGFYRASKQACEIIIEEYQKNFGVDYTILRYGSVYGPRADEKNMIYRIIKQAILKKTIQIDRGDDEKRDFIHVCDAARITVDVLKKRYRNICLIVTGHQNISRLELLNIINEILGGDVKIESPKKPKAYRAHGHYKFTPYVFKPQIPKKIVCQEYIEFGQGILNCIKEVYKKHVTQ